MGIENFIQEALHNPNDFIAYHVGRELAQLHPGKAIIEGETGSFDVEAFARAEKCSLVHETSLFNQIQTFWIRPAKLRRHIENSWLNVLWKGNLLEVLLLTFTQDCYTSRHHWIVADDIKVAEEFFDAVCAWSTEIRGEVLLFHDGEWTKSRELYQAIKAATFDSLILRPALKQQIWDDFTQFFQAREMYERHGIPWKRGVLFIGPPGNGKTHTVKALGNQLGRPCLCVKSFKSEYQTDQEGIRRVFARARITSPCLLVFEDLDSMIDDSSRSFFLNELDGFAANTGVLVLATTNHPERLDPAIVNRPSRFDRKYYFEPPGTAERAAYLSAWNNELQAALRISEPAAATIVEQSEGFSFAYLKELVLSSMMQWMTTEGRSPMNQIMAEQATQLQQQLKSGPPEKC